MNNDKRACMAYICGVILNVSSSYSSVYDFVRGEHYYYQKRTLVSGNRIQIYDYKRRGYIQVRLPNFYDYVSGFYILIKVERGKFKGYDYESGAYYMGEVRGNEIRIYDYEKSDYFRYKIY